MLFSKSEQHIKYDRNLERERGGGSKLHSVYVTVISWYLVIMTSFCSQGGEGQNRPKNAVILNVCPVAQKRHIISLSVQLHSSLGKIM